MFYFHITCECVSILGFQPCIYACTRLVLRRVQPRRVIQLANSLAQLCEAMAALEFRGSAGVLTLGEGPPARAARTTSERQAAPCRLLRHDRALEASSTLKAARMGLAATLAATLATGATLAAALSPRASWKAALSSVAAVRTAASNRDRWRRPDLCRRRWAALRGQGRARARIQHRNVS